MSDTASEYLSPGELHDFTGYARAGQQTAWLIERGIPHRLDGRRVILSRIHIQMADLAKERLGLLSATIDQYILRPDSPCFKRGTYPAGGEIAGIYMLLNEDGGVNYIGQSVGVGYRNVQHYWAVGRSQRLPFFSYAAIEVPDLLRLHLETAHIHALAPPENALPRVQWERHDEAVKLIREVWGGAQK